MLNFKSQSSELSSTPPLSYDSEQCGGEKSLIFQAAIKTYVIHDVTLTIWEQTEKLRWYGVQARLGLGDEESSRQRMKKQCNVNPSTYTYHILGLARHSEPNTPTRKPVCKQVPMENAMPLLFFHYSNKIRTISSQIFILSSCMTGCLLSRNSAENRIQGFWKTFSEQLLVCYQKPIRLKPFQQRVFQDVLTLVLESVCDSTSWLMKQE